MSQVRILSPRPVFKDLGPVKANTNGTERKNTARTGAWSHGIVPEAASDELLTLFADEPSRRLDIPVKIAPSENGRGFHHNGIMIFCGYWESGELMSVQDTLLGKKLWPERECGPAYEMPYDDSSVYFVQGANGPIKIGLARDPLERLKKLQCGSPVLLTLLCHCEGGQPLEREYHRRFADHRLHGEWFNPHPDILAEIERLT